jgi:hypothetical protein
MQVYLFIYLFIISILKLCITTMNLVYIPKSTVQIFYPLEGSSSLMYPTYGWV